MFYKRRELRRLWEVEVYKGDPEDSDGSTKKITTIAWNHVDAIRSAGTPVAKQPTALYFITWPDAEGNVYRINSTAEGPIGDPIAPSVVRAEPAKGDWQ